MTFFFPWMSTATNYTIEDPLQPLIYVGYQRCLKVSLISLFFPFPFFVQNWKSTFYCANTHFICILECSVWWAFSAGHYSFCRRQKPSRDFEKSEHVNSYLLPNWFVFDGIRSQIVLKMVSPRVSSKNVDRELWVSAHFHKRLILVNLSYLFRRKMDK